MVSECVFFRHKHLNNGGCDLNVIILLLIEWSVQSAHANIGAIYVVESDVGVYGPFIFELTFIVLAAAV